MAAGVATKAPSIVGGTGLGRLITVGRARDRQATSVRASLRYSRTAGSGTRKDRPTRTAASSPPCTRRYTVIFDTRMIAATSATVRKLTAGRGAGAGTAGRTAVASPTAGREGRGR